MSRKHGRKVLEVFQGDAYIYIIESRKVIRGITVDGIFEEQ